MKERIEASGLLDPEWYHARYPDVRMLGMDAAEHYLRIGASLLRDPGPAFSTAYYLAAHPDVAQAGVNPLWHYLAHGCDEGRRIAPSGHHLPAHGPEFPVPRLQARPLANPLARMVCFYLPQFHAIPENDEWWGEGFTEWTNVRPAKPQFLRHYQPHEPDPSVGYYDLTDPDVMRRQAELARLYGISAFCFYFYWFGGKRLLERPIRNYLDNGDIDLPFCLCWANENWSRRWDGRDQEVLIAQDHSPEDDIGFIRHVAEYLADPRYLRIDGKPILLVYRPNLLPDARETVARWRAWCRDNGIGEIYLAYTQSFESNDPGEYGFDAAIEFPPNNSGVPLITQFARPNADFQGRIYEWPALVERSHRYPVRPYKLFRGICPSWDNTARRGVNATVLANSSPRRFTEWARNAIRDTCSRFRQPDERLVFVNAWNEWAEGAHLEPDLRYGHAWLESVRVALESSALPTPLPVDAACPVAIVLEGDGVENLERVLEWVRTVDCAPVVFAMVAPSGVADVERRLSAAGIDHTVAARPDRPREPWLLQLLREGALDGAQLVLRLSTGQGEAASAALLDPEFFATAVARFAAEPTLGMLAPEPDRAVLPKALRSRFNELGARLGLHDEDLAILMAAGWRGRAFLARPEALAAIASLAFAPDCFLPGRAQYHGQWPIVIEHALALGPPAAGWRVDRIDAEAAAAGKPRVVIVSHDAHPHGAQLLALNMAKEYGALGFDVDMVVLGPGKLLERFAEHATVHRVDLDSQQASMVRRLLAALHAAGARVAIANTTVSGRIVPLLKQAGFDVVSLIHELPGILHGYGLQEHAQAIAAHADRVVFPARIVRDGFERFIGHGVGQAAMRPQGLYLRTPHRTPQQRAAMRAKVRQDLGLAPDARLVLCVGYADHRKGLDLFVEACAALMARDDKVVGLWVGHAQQQLFEQVDADIRQKGLEGRFVFTGLVDNPADYYAASDVYALTSREDPFPSVVMEAFDAFVPVVCFSGVVGSEELIERGTGLLVPAFDTTAMADAIASLLEDDGLRMRLAGRGHDIVDQELSFRHYLYDLMALSGHPIPKVSVVVPNYNYARFMAQRLASIRAQTAPVFELIVLDDRSSDDSVAVVASWLADCDIPHRLVVNEENSGSVFRQWQRGVAMARGDYVWIAEADDLSDPDFLAEALAGFSDPRVGLSYCQSKQMGAEGEILCNDYLDYVADIDGDRWRSAYKADGREEIATALFIKNTIPNVSGVVFRRDALREVLERHGDEIASYRNAGDWVAYLRLLEKHAVSFSPRALNLHRRHQGSVTIGGFNVSQLAEIVKVQRDTIRRFSLGHHAVEKADRYAQTLYVQFGLATDGSDHFTQHPSLRTSLEPGGGM